MSRHSTLLTLHSTIFTEQKKRVPRFQQTQHTIDFFCLKVAIIVSALVHAWPLKCRAKNTSQLWVPIRVAYL